MNGFSFNGNKNQSGNMIGGDGSSTALIAIYVIMSLASFVLLGMVAKSKNSHKTPLWILFTFIIVSFIVASGLIINGSRGVAVFFLVVQFALSCTLFYYINRATDQDYTDVAGDNTKSPTEIINALDDLFTTVSLNNKLFVSGIITSVIAFIVGIGVCNLESSEGSTSSDYGNPYV